MPLTNINSDWIWCINMQISRNHPKDPFPIKWPSIRYLISLHMHAEHMTSKTFSLLHYLHYNVYSNVVGVSVARVFTF